MFYMSYIFNHLRTIYVIFTNTLEQYSAHCSLPMHLVPIWIIEIDAGFDSGLTTSVLISPPLLLVFVSVRMENYFYFQEIFFVTIMS